jgi:protein-L-isoaspartate O-methyltransferase
VDFINLERWYWSKVLTVGGGVGYKTVVAVFVAMIGGFNVARQCTI